jgi:protein-L-isoaspartate O-methyltransferase
MCAIAVRSYAPKEILMDTHSLIRFRERRLVFTDTAIRDELGHDVMMDWEHPIMKRHAELICEPGWDVLEIGFGMAISASYIQALKPRSHTIVDCHPQVLERAHAWAKDKPSVRIVAGEWFERLADLGTYDGILYDIYDDPNVDDFYATFETLLKPGGRMTFYNRLPRPENEAGLACEYHEVDVKPDANDYHNGPKYYVPVWRAPGGAAGAH